jgi:hypothetical protein
MMSGDYYKRDEPLFAVDLARKDAGHAIVCPPIKTYPSFACKVGFKFGQSWMEHEPTGGIPCTYLNDANITYRILRKQPELI